MLPADRAAVLHHGRGADPDRVLANLVDRRGIGIAALGDERLDHRRRQRADAITVVGLDQRGRVAHAALRGFGSAANDAGLRDGRGIATVRLDDRGCVVGSWLLNRRLLAVAALVDVRGVAAKHHLARLRGGRDGKRGGAGRSQQSQPHDFLAGTGPNLVHRSKRKLGCKPIKPINWRP